VIVFVLLERVAEVLGWNVVETRTTIGVEMVEGMCGM
jgi:hypothetical protein